MTLDEEEKDQQRIRDAEDAATQAAEASARANTDVQAARAEKDKTQTEKQKAMEAKAAYFVISSATVTDTSIKEFDSVGPAVSPFSFSTGFL